MRTVRDRRRVARGVALALLGNLAAVEGAGCSAFGTATADASATDAGHSAETGANTPHADDGDASASTYGAALSTGECAQKILAGRCDIASGSDFVGATDAWAVQLTRGGVATHLEFYLEQVSDELTIFAGVYDELRDSNGPSPNTLLTSGQVTVASSGWVSVPLHPPLPLVANAHVWLAVRGSSQFNVRLETSSCSVMGAHVWDYRSPVGTPLPTPFFVNERIDHCNVSARLLP